MAIEAMKNALATLEDIFGKNKVDVGVITELRQAISQQSDKLKADIGPADFGVPEKYKEYAENYAAYKVSEAMEVGREPGLCCNDYKHCKEVCTVRGEKEEQERIRELFKKALADKGTTWPGEANILYAKCFRERL